MTEIFS